MGSVNRFSTATTDPPYHRGFFLSAQLGDLAFMGSVNRFSTATTAPPSNLLTASVPVSPDTHTNSYKQLQSLSKSIPCLICEVWSAKSDPRADPTTHWTPVQSGDLPVVPSPLAQSHSWSHKRVLTAHVPPNRTELAVDTHDCLWLLTQGCERGRAWHLKQSPPAHGGATVAVEHLVRNAAHFVVVVPRQLGAGTDVPETGGDWSGVAKATHNIDTNNTAQLVNRHQPEATQRWVPETYGDWKGQGYAKQQQRSA